MIVRSTLVASLLLPASAAVDNPRPPIMLAVSPAHVTLAGNARQTIAVTSSGRGPVVVDVTRAGFRLDLRGRPRIVPIDLRRAAVASWLSVAPPRLMLRPGETAPLTVSAALPPQPRPGDHEALVLLTARPRSDGDVAVRMRVGIVIDVQARSCDGSSYARSACAGTARSGCLSC